MIKRSYSGIYCNDGFYISKGDRCEFLEITEGCRKDYYCCILFEDDDDINEDQDGVVRCKACILDVTFDVL